MVDFKIKSLSNVMGAEINGLDLNTKLINEDKQKLIKAITDHLVICIKNQSLSPKKLVEVSKIFGKPKKYFVKDETIENVAKNILTQEKTVAVIDANNKVVGSINPTKIINTVFGGRKKNS